MWTVNDCDASKKRKAFKNSDNGKLRGGGGAREEVGRERKGVEGPTPTNSLADRSNGRGRGRAAVRSGDAVEGFASTGQRPRTTAQPYAGVHTGHKRETGRHSPTHLNGRAGRFGIFCLIACAPLSVVVEFRTTSFFFCFFHFTVSCISKVCEGVTRVSLQRGKPLRWIGTQQTIQTTLHHAAVCPRAARSDSPWARLPARTGPGHVRTIQRTRLRPRGTRPGRPFARSDRCRLGRTAGMPSDSLDGTDESDGTTSDCAVIMRPRRPHKNLTV